MISRGKSKIYWHAYNPITWKAEVGRFLVNPELQSENFVKTKIQNKPKNKDKTTASHS